MIRNEATGNIIMPLQAGYSLGAGLQFDGVNDFVQLGTITLDALSDFSVCGLIQCNNRATTNQRLIGNIVNPLGDLRGWFMSIINNVMYVGIYTDLQNSSGTGVIAGTSITSIPVPNVFHFAFCKETANSNVWRLYINAVEGTKVWLNGSRIVNGTTTQNPYRIGETTAAAPVPFNGIIYDLKIFNKALTQAEVTHLFQRRNVILPATATSNVIANWRFNQKSGTILTDETGAWNGTLSGFANTTPSVGNAWVDSDGNSITF